MTEKSPNRLDSDNIGPLLFHLAMPAFVGIFVMTLYNVVDAVFIGHYVGPLGLAALAIVFPVQMLAMGIGHMTGMGGASLISRQIGARDRDNAEKTLGNAVGLNFLISGAMMVAGLVWLDACLARLGTSVSIFPYARDYMQVILIGLFFQTFAMLLSNLIRAEGNARIPMVGMIIGAGLNTGLDALFVIGLGMGVKGAALATVIGESVTTVFFIWYYFSGNNFLKLKIANLLLDWKIVIRILAVGISAFASSVATSVSAIFINRICLVYGGDMAVCVFGIINRIVMFVLMPGIVIGMGLQPIVGFNYGARRYDRVIRSIVLAMGWATFFSVIAWAGMVFMSEPLISIFTRDRELISIAGYASRRLFAGVFLVGFIIVGSTVFQALGMAVRSFVMSLGRPVLFLIPLALLLPRFIQLDGIWLAFSFSDVLTFALTLILLVPQIRMLVSRSKDTGVPDTG